MEEFTLTDASGRIVRQWKPSTRTAAQHTFSVEGISSGMYTVSCTTSGDSTLAAKLVVR
ncbi:MAG: T9SS type A sorting domain-containing protein [Flavobacteriales bacterium]|nr:T9SS type A sorting domain-containing protein [Flavobacteriales bacterium]